MPYTSNVESNRNTEPTKIIAGTATAADVRNGTNFVPNTAANQVIAGAMPNCKITEVTPGNVDQVIERGAYIDRPITVKGDRNLAAGNIKAGVSIFGVAGNENVVDTSAGTADAADMRKGKKAHVGGKLVTGTIPDNTVTEITPGTKEQTIGIGQYIAKAIKILGDAKLLAANIKANITIFGVKGTFTADATADAADILTNKSAYKNGGKLTGTMADRTQGSGLTLTASDKRTLWQQTYNPSGDARVWWIKNSDNNERLCVQSPVAGKVNTSTVVGVPIANIRDILGVNANKIVSGQSIAGVGGNRALKFTTKIDAMAYSMSYIAADLGPHEASFTMPENGYVIYGGLAICERTGTRYVVCEVYHNGVLVDNRNCSGSDGWIVRGTMVNCVRAANKGDVIRIVAQTGNLVTQLSTLWAMGVYF